MARRSIRFGILTVALICGPRGVALSAGDTTDPAGRSSPPHAWTLAEATKQLNRHPHNAYLQYVAMQPGRSATPTTLRMGRPTPSSTRLSRGWGEDWGCWRSAVRVAVGDWWGKKEEWPGCLGEGASRPVSARQEINYRFPRVSPLITGLNHHGVR